MSQAIRLLLGQFVQMTPAIRRSPLTSPIADPEVPRMLRFQRGIHTQDFLNIFHGEQFLLTQLIIL